MTSNLATSIADNGPNVQTITIHDAYEISLADNALLSFSALKNPKSLKLIFSGTRIRPESQFLKTVVPSLEKLYVFFQIKAM